MHHRERLWAIYEWPGNHWRLLLLVACGLALLDALLIYAPLLALALAVLIGAALVGLLIGILLANLLW